MENIEVSLEHLFGAFGISLKIRFNPHLMTGLVIGLRID
jgi:hypothetical protein